MRYPLKLALIALQVHLWFVPPRTANAGDYIAVDLNPSYGGYSIGYGAGGNQQVGMTGAGGAFQATLWSKSSASAVSLLPQGFTGSYAYNTDGATQVGEFWGPTTNRYAHAVMWTGTASSYRDLHPPAAFASRANGVNGSLQVGQGTFAGGNSRAMLWSGSAASARDITPSGIYDSGAYSIDGVQIAGFTAVFDKDRHAALWDAATLDWVDLNPAEIRYSEAFGVAAGQQVGQYAPSNTLYAHAALWTGTAASLVDLNGPPLEASTAFDTNGNQQVGEGLVVNKGYHAIVWSGSPESLVDLNDFLPTGWVTSTARGIDQNGNIFGWATSFAGAEHSFLWIPVPEPCYALAWVGALLMLRQRMR